jgi:hypothetical protein
VALPADTEDSSDPGSPLEPRVVARRARKRRARKRREESGGTLSLILASLQANLPFLLTRVLPVLLLVLGVVGTAAYIQIQKRQAKALAELADRLWTAAGGPTTDVSSAPYVRGRLAILETQSTVKVDHQVSGKPSHWINDHIPPPLDDAASIGSVILVEWQVVEDVARNAAGMPMTVGKRGGPPAGDSDPVMLKRWNCRVRLVDLKRRIAVYEARLRAPDRTFNEGDLALVTPSTVVTDQQLAGEFNKIRAFPHIALDDDPPAAGQSKQ